MSTPYGTGSTAVAVGTPKPASRPRHALAPELGLRPELTHLGATVPTTGLYVLEEQYDDPAACADWLDRARPVVSALLSRPEGDLA